VYNRKTYTIWHGEVAEWPNAAVLKDEKNHQYPLFAITKEPIIRRDIVIHLMPFDGD
jgi:hypothetical protein